MPDVRTRREVERLASRLAGHGVVLDTDVDEDHDGPFLTVILVPGVERVPPGVLFALYDDDFGIADVSPQGSPSHLFVRVR